MLIHYCTSLKIREALYIYEYEPSQALKSMEKDRVFGLEGRLLISAPQYLFTCSDDEHRGLFSSDSIGHLHMRMTKKFQFQTLLSQGSNKILSLALKCTCCAHSNQFLRLTKVRLPETVTMALNVRHPNKT